MRKSLSEKFDVIDLVLTNYGLFLTEKEFETATMKKYAVKVLKDNTEEIDVIAEKVNDLIRGKEVGEIDHAKMESYSDQLTALSEEFEKKAEIICNLYTDAIKIEIRMPEESVIFKFKEDDYFDTLIDYLKNNLGQKLLR
ncbi:hypothetical protein [Cytobacillus sp. FSL H8-0458]|uniref:hypothetical protein n=1 Tax=Cytobacillus sp. FSL H8-0458 TaxID=2975346 RepID=UPI0030F7FF70